MASLQKFPSGTFHITIPFGGKRYKRSLKTKDRRTALAIEARVEDTIKLVEQGRIEIPDSADVPTFLLSDGKAIHQLEAPQETKLNRLFESYFDSIPTGSLEPATIEMMRMHSRHLMRHLGNRFSLRTLTQAILQSYISKRSKEPGTRGRTVQAATIKKELTTLRGLWKWAVIGELLPNAPIPSVGLRFPISEELPPFQTFETVLEQTSSLDPESAEFKDLWATVFLNQTEIEELLSFVKKNARHAFIYPMFVFAAHTGARKSEILRSQMTDFGSGLVSVRERKRKKGRKSTRQLPISSCLENAIKQWFKEKPNSPFTICHAFKSNCRSQPGEPLTPSQANKHFKTTVSGSRFKNLRGWHALRHSFCSNAAAKGISQAIIDSWVGHSTPEMSRRYHHLHPNLSRDAMSSLFD